VAEARAGWIHRLPLAALVGIGIAAFARAQNAPGAWALLAPVALSLWFSPARLPGPLQRTIRYGARLWMGVTAFFALLSSIYPIFGDETIARASLLLGYGLAAFSVVFLLGQRFWPPSSNALPAAVGTLAAASLHPTAPLTFFHASFVACLVIYACATGDTIEPPGHASRTRVHRWIRLFLYSAVACALAVGIARFLPWAQPQVEEATARALNPSYAISQPAFSEHARLGSVESLALSHRVVLRLWSDAAMKLRGRVLVDFDGQTWHGARTVQQPLVLLGVAPPAPPSLGQWLAKVEGAAFAEPGPLSLDERQRARVVMVMDLAGPLMTPARTQLVKLNAPALARDGYGIVQAPAGPVEVFAIVPGTRVEVSAEDALPRARYLVLAPDTDPRLRVLAASLSEGAQTDEERVSRTLAYLARELQYSLTPGKFHSRQPIAEFLFEKKKGYCEYFASAAAVLLRLQGVPTRYVSGFSPSEDSRVAGHYVVRESEAHAWIEAFLPGRGWMEIDPTPAAQLASFRGEQREGWFSRTWGWLRSVAAAVRARLVFGGWSEVVALLRSPVVWAVAAVALVAASLFVLRRCRPRRRIDVSAPVRHEEDSVPPEIAALLAGLDAAWTRRGYTRPAHRAPLEHLRSLSDGALPPEAQAASARAVDCFYAARFARRCPPPAEVAQIRAELERVLGRRA
jgi:hypothetical protein